MDTYRHLLATATDVARFVDRMGDFEDEEERELSAQAVRQTIGHLKRTGGTGLSVAVLELIHKGLDHAV